MWLAERLMLKYDLRAVCYASLLFVVPYTMVVLSTVLWVPDEPSRLVFAVVAYASLPVIAALIAVGYLAAWMAGNSGVANGAASGLIVTTVLLAAPYISLNFNLSVVDYVRVYGPHALVMGVFWCSLGGLIRELLQGFRTA